MLIFHNYSMTFQDWQMVFLNFVTFKKVVTLHFLSHSRCYQKSECSSDQNFNSINV